MTRERLALTTLGVLLVAGIAVVGGAAAVERPAAPVTVDTNVRPPTDLTELVDRADLVVVGRVARVEPGRVVSSGADPTAAVRTQVAELVVDEVTVGQAPARVVVEEVAALADGTPAAEGGVRPSRVGDAGLYLLVQGPDATAPVGPHGRFLLDPRDPGRLLNPLPGDLLADELTGLGPRGLRDAVIRSGR